MPRDAPGAGVSDVAREWPEIPLDAWRDTRDTLHMCTQVVGKTRLALAPMENHWWNVTLYVTSRGLTTSPMPYAGRTVQVDFDFIEHRVVVSTSDGSVTEIPLEPQPVADFYAVYMTVLRSMGLNVRLYGVPVEVATAIPFREDRVHAAYDAEAVTRFWRALVCVDRVMKRFRGRFLGKASPVHFFWGAFDLATTRFSGRPAPPHPGGAPNCPRRVMVEGYSHECASAGFWPGDDSLPEPAFYAYAYPEPPGYSQHSVGPAGAYYHPVLREYILPYDVVRQAPSPDASLLEFLQSTYDAAADLAAWNRAALDRPESEWP